MRWTDWLSILGHAFVFLYLFTYSPLPHPEEEGSHALETRTLSEKEFEKLVQKRMKKQIVQKEDSIKTKEFRPNPNEDVFLSTQNQYSDRNTRAARVGAHKNVLKEGLKDVSELFKIEKPSQAKADTPSKELDQKPETALKGIEKAKTHAGKTTSFAPKTGRSPASAGEGFSATDDYLPNIAIGANTLLNTREYKYASFYERIRVQLKNEWERRLRGEIEGLSRKGVMGFEGERITRLKVYLDKRGQLQKVRRLGSAGYRELDRAAIEAFHEASPFPNPPSELLAEDTELLEVEWSFVVLGGGYGSWRVNVHRNPAANF